MKKYNKKSLERRREGRVGYKEFYEEQVKLCRGKRCMSCSRKLRGDVSEIAHILPKSIFKSIATNPLSVLFLCSNKIYGSDGCHDKYDRSWEDAKSMPIWVVVIERYNLLKEEIKEYNWKILNHFE